MDTKRKKAEELIDIQTSHTIKFLLTSIITYAHTKYPNVVTTKLAEKYFKKINKILPYKPVGVIQLDDREDGTLWLSIKPCLVDHCLDTQFRSAPCIMNDKAKEKTMLNTMSSMLSLTRRMYLQFLLDNESLIKKIVNILPENMQDITLKVDVTNTTLYIYNECPIRAGFYIERDNYIKSRKNDYVGGSENNTINDTIIVIKKAINEQKIELNALYTQ